MSSRRFQTIQHQNLRFEQYVSISINKSFATEFGEKSRRKNKRDNKSIASHKLCGAQ